LTFETILPGIRSISNKRVWQGDLLGQNVVDPHDGAADRHSGSGASTSFAVAMKA
jgi:hypothetical protein